MASVDERVCDEKHKAIHGEFKGIRATQDLHRQSLANLETGQKWLKPIFLLLGLVFLTVAATLTRLVVKDIYERLSNHEVSRPVSGSVHVDSAD